MKRSALVFLILLAGIRPSLAQASPLYERIGKGPVIISVVDDLIDRVTHDHRINGFFRHTDRGVFRRHMIEFLEHATGGPQVYTGKPMAEAHAGLAIDDRAFDAFMDDLSRSLDQEHVAPDARQELLALLAPLRAQVIHPLELESLYTRLGGESVLHDVATRWVDLLVNDTRLGSHFLYADRARWTDQLDGYLTQVSGGPSREHGTALRTLRDSLAIDGTQFDAMVDDLGQVLRQQPVDPTLRQRLLDTVSGTRADVIRR